MVSCAPRRVALSLFSIVLLAEPAAAHIGALGEVSSSPIPFWFIAMSGGAVIGVSFLFATLVTDDEIIEAVNDRRRLVAVSGTRIRTWAVRVAGLAGLAVLALVLVSGFFGPRDDVANAGVLVVWAGWWAGYTMTVYLLGNTWPLLNPWRTIASLLPRLRGTYPERLGAWPSVVGLLALVWVEVVTPVADDPRLLATVVLVYTVVTVTGAVAYGVETWFGVVDPIARVFRYYGRMAPIQRTDGGVEFVPPSTALTRFRIDGVDEVAFVIALLWVTTFDGLVSTPTWATAIAPIADVGVPGPVIYLVSIVAGFWLFFAAYRVASRRSRRSANSYVTAAFIRDWFAPALIPIAAGYHLAHFVGYLIALSPALVAAVASPIAGPPAPDVLAPPGWFGSLQLVFVLLGHGLAIWVSHALAFELFPGRLQPIRSQYPFIVVMILYTMTSMWIVAQPTNPPPYV